MTAPWQIRALGPEDLPRYRPLRLEALRDHPEAFGSSFEEERTDDMTRLIGEPPSLTLGGFVGETLAGTIAFIVSPKVKQCHKGHVVAAYVAPPWRGSGLARALLDDLIDRARAAGLVQLTLSVTVGNEAARRLYRRAGFVPYGVEPRCLKVGPEMFDAEFMVLLLP